MATGRQLIVEMDIEAKRFAQILYKHSDELAVKLSKNPLDTFDQASKKKLPDDYHAAALRVCRLLNVPVTHFNACMAFAGVMMAHYSEIAKGETDESS